MAATASATNQPLATRKVSRFYQPELDCLRFFAFLSVFICHILPQEPTYYVERHIPFPILIASAGRAGSFGVDLFFLLSAFLITELLLREKEEFGRVHLRAFYTRRILRIWPLYFFAIGIGAVLPYIDSSQYFPARYVVTFLLLSGNWLVSFTRFPESVMIPLWSVSFEEQFYLFWASAVAKTKRASTLLITCAFLLFVAQVSRLVLLRFDTRGSTLMIFTNTLARLDPLALGIATAIITRKRQFQFGWVIRIAFLLGGILVWLLAGHYFKLNRGFMVLGYPGMALGALLIFLSVFRISWTPVWLRYLGKISYGLYVFHMLGLYIADKLIGGHAKSFPKLFSYWGIGFALTVILAMVSYRFFESPFLTLKERFAYVRSRPV